MSYLLLASGDESNAAAGASTSIVAVVDSGAGTSARAGGSTSVVDVAASGAGQVVGPPVVEGLFGGGPLPDLRPEPLIKKRGGAVSRVFVVARGGGRVSNASDRQARLYVLLKSLPPEPVPVAEPVPVVDPAAAFNRDRRLARLQASLPPEIDHEAIARAERARQDEDDMAALLELIGA